MNQSSIAKRLDLPDGSAIVLIDVLGKGGAVPQADRESNVLRIDPQGRVVWRVSADAPIYPGSPFTGIGFDEKGRLMGYRWDGVEYEIDLDTGMAKSTEFLR